MFRIPEEHRIKGSGNGGQFSIPSPLKRNRSLFVQASDNSGWEHVSVSAREGQVPKTPTWDEMCFIKDKFWEDWDVVMQLHPAKLEYVNNHPNVLHLWRPIGIEIPTPPSILVGLKFWEHLT